MPSASPTKSNFIFQRETMAFVLLAVMVAFGLTRWTVAQPNYTDAYYHFNAATRLVSGQGLTDAYLWNYINAPQSLAPGEVVPSHTYWMPLTSLSAALGMWLLNVPGNYAAAQWPFALMLVGTGVSGFWLGHRLGGTRRHAWGAGLVTLFSGFFTRFWGATDTFAPYAIAGALCLIFIGLGIQAFHARQHQRMYLWFALAGVAAGFGHLARADGLLLLLVGGIVILWHWEVRKHPLPGLRISALLVLIVGYLLVMLPWFVRNLNAVGSPLPVGGFQAVWFTEYNDLFSYPADASPATLFANGLGAFFQSRWTALTNNVGTLVAVEGLIVMTPFMLLALWKRRQDSFLRGFWLYALGLHLAMTLVFPFPGYRGGLFHSAAALVPWWAALGVVGLDDAIEWIAKRRRTWKPRTAKPVFSVGLVLLALVFSFSMARRTGTGTPALFRELEAVLPAEARVMINDPAALYYFTGLSGVVLPNEAPDIIPELAQRFSVTHLLIEFSDTAQGRAYAVPTPLIFDLDSPPEFLQPIPLNVRNARLYAIAPD